MELEVLKLEVMEELEKLELMVEELVELEVMLEEVLVLVELLMV